MPFQKNHKFGFLPKDSIPLDSLPLTLKLRVGVRAKVISTPDWQNELRDVIERWIENKLDLDDQV